MRLGSFIGLQNSKAVQSYGWNLIRPLGCIQNVLSSMDQYECDELAIIRITRGHPNKSLYASDLATLEMCKFNSPLSFGGGIRNRHDVNRIRALPVERIIFLLKFSLRYDCYRNCNRAIWSAGGSNFATFQI